MLGAEDGLFMGPLMAITVIFIGASTYYTWASIPGLIGVLAVPVLAYFRLALGYRANPHGMSITSLWLQGICMFFFGGLIMSAIAFSLMRWAVPGFINHQIDTIIEVYGSMNNPSAAEMAQTFGKLKSAGMLPSPLDVALELLYISVFTGSLLSFIFSFIIRRRTPTPPVYRS